MKNVLFLIFDCLLIQYSGLSQVPKQIKYKFDFVITYEVNVKFKDTSDIKNYSKLISTRLNTKSNGIFGSFTPGIEDDRELTITDIPNRIGLVVEPTQSTGLVKNRQHIHEKSSLSNVNNYEWLDMKFVKNPFRKTGNKATINGFKCEEWVSDLDTSNTYSIWIANRPAQIPDNVYLATVGPIRIAGGWGLPVKVINVQSSSTIESILKSYKQENYVVGIVDGDQ